jgi:hypothetical protein
MGDKLNTKDKTRLNSALAKLPPEINYLREAIMKISMEDQDLLGSGEADIDPIFKAFKAAILKFQGATASDHAHILRKWLKKMPHHTGKWAAPLWFVEGVLRGFEFFDIDLDSLPARPVPKGLEKTELEVPLTMKTKLYVRGIELRERGVQIIIAEIDDDLFDGKLKAAISPPQTSFPKPPHLRDELVETFHIAQANGTKLITSHVESGLPIMVMYLLSLNDVKLEIWIFAKKERGSNIEKYESLLSSIRLKNSKNAGHR